MSSDRYVTVATYSIPLEAQLAAGRLEEEDIPAVVAGGLTADTLGIGGLGGTVEVRVPEAAAEKALNILAACAGLKPEPGWEEQLDPAADVWVCSLCGEAVPLDEATCPSCETPRDAIRSADPALALAPRPQPSPEKHAEKVQRRDQVTPGSSPASGHDLTEESEDLPAETFLGDDLARRAFRSAVLGTVALPLTAYSLWLQLRLSLFPQELSPFALSRLRWTFLINAGALLMWSFFLWLWFAVAL